MKRYNVNKPGIHILCYEQLLQNKQQKSRRKIKDQAEKQIKALENRVETFFSEADQKSIASFCSKDFVNEEATYELSKIVEMENKLNRDYLIYKTDNMKKDKTFKSFKSQAFKSLKE